VARALGLQHTQVHVTCKRVGGGFGGKVRPWRVAAGVAACCWQLLLVCTQRVGRQDGRSCRENTGDALVALAWLLSTGRSLLMRLTHWFM
jgi:xanthine dehydrogenase molybdopterin-binding subunit B